MTRDLDRPEPMMGHVELRTARERLGLTPSEAATVLETDVTTVRKIERDPANATARPAPARVAQLYRAFLFGFRPAGWPERLLRAEAVAEEKERMKNVERDAP